MVNEMDLASSVLVNHAGAMNRAPTKSDKQCRGAIYGALVRISNYSPRLKGVLL